MGKKKADGESALAKYGQRVRRSARMREFPWLGWTVVLVPLDVFESRSVARMYIGMGYGFEPDELIELRARRLKLGKRERTWWVMAICTEASDRRRKPPLE